MSNKTFIVTSFVAIAIVAYAAVTIYYMFQPTLQALDECISNANCSTTNVEH